MSDASRRLRALACAAALAALAAGCDDSAPASASRSALPRPTGPTRLLAGEADGLAAFLAPLHGEESAARWQQERIRAMVRGGEGLGFLSLRVYRVGSDREPLALDPLELVVRLADGTEHAARELPPAAASAHAERPVIEAHSLAAFRGRALEPSRGFEAWVALPAELRLETFAGATLRAGGNTVELAPRDVDAEQIAAFAGEPRRESILARARSGTTPRDLPADREAGDGAAPGPAPIPADDVGDDEDEDGERRR